TPPTVLENWRQATSGKLVSKAPEATRDIYYLAQKASDSRYTERQWILRRDGDLYFPETFVPRRLKEDYGITNLAEAEDRAKRGRDALKVLLQATDALNITRPTPYYAAIQMDGDNMGLLLSGVQNDTEHHNISHALSSFSRETALDLIEKQYPARLVYAGGDDVLAFAPLARDTAEVGQPGHVFDLVDMLQRYYRENVVNALPTPQNRTRVEGITASTGVVIAHHYTSLSYVLRSAREAESIAKKRYGRNALVVTLIRRSGEQTRVGCHWRYPQLGSDDDPGQPIALFSRFYHLFQEDVLSPKCVYTLLEEAPALVKMRIEETSQSQQSSSAMQSEIKRVLKRQRDTRREADFPDSEVEQYARYLTHLAAAIDADEYPHLSNGMLKTVELHAETRRYGFVEVLGWLLVMAFLARKEQE
ncbi:MAG: type III-B CRISPR-associated protein Cas10/Cmr2, partial [Ktedonobacteraceae bacterium]|nr:type III-B CRISPR-associated protein Cas10/Cmr2 [Ktedonobacteraceae bacterium]